MGDVANMTEDFSVTERLLLLGGVLPPQGDITTIRLVRQLREELSFSEEEHAALELTIDPATTNAKWSPKKEEQSGPKAIAVGPKMREVIVAGLKAASNAGQLRDDHLPLWDRFVPEATEEGVA